MWLLNQSFSLFGHGGQIYRTVVATLFSVPLSDSITIGLGPLKTFFELIQRISGALTSNIASISTGNSDTVKCYRLGMEDPGHL